MFEARKLRKPQRCASGLRLLTTSVEPETCSGADTRNQERLAFAGAKAANGAFQTRRLPPRAEACGSDANHRHVFLTRLGQPLHGR